MTRTGNLLRLARQQEAAHQLCECGHANRLHLELDYEDPRYRMLVFHCRECECEKAADR